MSTPIARLTYRLNAHTHKDCAAKAELNMVKRNREQFTVGDASFAPQQAKKEWATKGKHITRAPTPFLDKRNPGVRFTDHKDPGENRRKHESNLFLTINTNKTLDAFDENYICVRALRQTLVELRKTNNMCSYLIFGPVNPHYRDDPFDAVINDIQWDANVELGDNYQRLHAHIWLTIEHYSEVQVNSKLLQFLAKETYNKLLQELASTPTEKANVAEWTLTGLPYVHVKLLPQTNWTEVMRSYIHKAMTTQ
tara:strand:+ start:612 stop:1367 length:756 start_codon:yes stop_codon:yes gene_type:complete